MASSSLVTASATTKPVPPPSIAANFLDFFKSFFVLTATFLTTCFKPSLPNLPNVR